jgi:hypothetical protein
LARKLRATLAAHTEPEISLSRNAVRDWVEDALKTTSE